LIRSKQIYSGTTATPDTSLSPFWVFGQHGSITQRIVEVTCFHIGRSNSRLNTNYLSLTIDRTNGPLSVCDHYIVWNRNRTRHVRRT